MKVSIIASTSTATVQYPNRSRAQMSEISNDAIDPRHRAATEKREIEIDHQDRKTPHTVALSLSDKRVTVLQQKLIRE